MGLLDLFGQQTNNTPVVSSILPTAAKQQISQGILPVINADKLFLKSGEVCHYADCAIYEKKTVRKKYVRKSTGYSMPGLFKGTRINLGGGNTDVVDNVSHDTYNGVLYVTNKRIIFANEQSNFSKKVEDLVSATPYSNCIELQFEKETLKVFVPDGAIVHSVLKMIY